jgi:hypothetical protein
MLYPPRWGQQERGREIIRDIAARKINQAEHVRQAYS